MKLEIIKAALVEAKRKTKKQKQREALSQELELKGIGKDFVPSADRVDDVLKNLDRYIPRKGKED